LKKRAKDIAVITAGSLAVSISIFPSPRVERRRFPLRRALQAATIAPVALSR
jgi:hypothetical protein